MVCKSSDMASHHVRVPVRSPGSHAELCTTARTQDGDRTCEALLFNIRCLIRRSARSHLSNGVPRNKPASSELSSSMRSLKPAYHNESRKELARGTL